MNRGQMTRLAQKMRDSALRASRSAWEVEDNLNAIGFFGRDAFGSEARASDEALQLIAEIDELVALRDELKALL